MGKGYYMFDYDAYMLTEVRLFLRKKLFLAISPSQKGEKVLLSGF